MSAKQTASTDHSLSTRRQWQPLSPPQTPQLRPTTLPKESTCSTRATTPLLLSPPSYLSSSPLLGSSDEGESQSEEISSGGLQDSIHQNHQSPKRSQALGSVQVATRPHLRQAPHSHSPSSSNTSCERTPQRRCVSADVANRIQAHFSSPNRFLSSRSSPLSLETPYHFNKNPTSLSPLERAARERDQTQDPFRPTSTSISRRLVQRYSALRRSNAPHFVPHFVQDNEHTEVQNDGNNHMDIQRRVSVGAIWNVGGNRATFAGPQTAIDNGRGALIGSGSNAPFFITHFLDHETPSQDIDRHRSRLSLALDIDEASRVLKTHPKVSTVPPSVSSHVSTRYSPLTWRNGTWMREGQTHVPSTSPSQAQRAVPATPFRVLDAPRLRDDFYCSTLAYCDTTRTLAVGLSPRVYLWSEEGGVRYPPLTSPSPTDYVTSLSFSSAEGGKSILAVGRLSGQILLWSTFDRGVRFEAQQPNPVSCLAFSPFVTVRPSEFLPGEHVPCEDLLVGDDMGNVFYYSVEWPNTSSLQVYPQWTGSMTLLAKVTAHSQQICGLSWSPDKKHFATGGNDNLALLFEIAKLLVEERRPEAITSLGSPFEYDYCLPAYGVPQHQPVTRGRSHFARLSSRFRSRDVSRDRSIRPPRTARSLSPPNVNTQPSSPTSMPEPEIPELVTLPLTRTFRYLQDRVDPSATTAEYSTLFPTHALNAIQKHSFPHAAAVKALAFPIWQPTLLATGGGSNDRAIHFFHTGSGATLASISVHAQVTALIWSKTKREVCATFGYAQPEHGIRIAVFAWPSGECVVSIPWTNEASPTGGSGGRALWAIAYPGGPNDGSTSSRTRSARTRRSQRRDDGNRGRANANTIPAVAEASDEDRPEGDEIPPAVLEEQAAHHQHAPRDQRRRQRPRHQRRPARPAHPPPSSSPTPPRTSHGDGEGGTWWSRTEQEGCIIVASSDESVKFHEVWAGRSTTTTTGTTDRSQEKRGGKSSSPDWLAMGLGARAGVLGGSDILEGVCEGIEIDRGFEGGGGIR